MVTDLNVGTLLGASCAESVCEPPEEGKRKFNKRQLEMIRNVDFTLRDFSLPPTSAKVVVEMVD